MTLHRLTNKEDNPRVLRNPKTARAKPRSRGQKNLCVYTMRNHCDGEIVQQGTTLGFMREPTAGGNQMQAAWRDGVEGCALTLPNLVRQILGIS